MGELLRAGHARGPSLRAMLDADEMVLAAASPRGEQAYAVAR